jgi:hypothetical protein
MPAVSISSQSSISVELSVPFDATWATLEVWASRKVREADVPGYMALVDDTFVNADSGDGNAKKTVSFEDLKMENSKKIFIRVVGVRSNGTKEALRDQTSVEVTRSNAVNEEVAGLDVVDYPSTPQVPFGFQAHEVRVVHRSGVKVYYSYDGLADHGEVDSTETDVTQRSGSVYRTLGSRIFLRAEASAGATVLVQARRHDSEYR